jgi:hypothetical protein
MPIETLEEKVRLTKPLEQHNFTRTYIKDGGPPGDNARGAGASAFWQAADYTRSNPAWRYYELPCGHSIHRAAVLDAGDLAGAGRAGVEHGAALTLWLRLGQATLSPEGERGFSRKR